MPGMLMSERTSSGVSASMRSRPSAPSLAVATRKPAPSRISTISSRTESSSSTTRTLSPGMASVLLRAGSTDQPLHRGHDRVGDQTVRPHQLGGLARAWDVPNPQQHDPGFPRRHRRHRLADAAADAVVLYDHDPLRLDRRLAEGGLVDGLHG